MLKNIFTVYFRELTPTSTTTRKYLLIFTSQKSFLQNTFCMLGFRKEMKRMYHIYRFQVWTKKFHAIHPTTIQK